MPIVALDIGRIRREIDDPRRAGFGDDPKPIDAPGDRSPRFVRRPHGETA